MDEQQTTDTAEWAYTGSDDIENKPAHIDAIEWSASEYIAHEKDAIWYLATISAAVAVTIIVWFITQELLASITILVVSFAALFFAGRKPATKTYYLSDAGLKIDGKKFDLREFRSFSVVEEGAINSIWLKPLGRFTPMIILYFDPQDENKISEALSAFLPYEQRELDAVDRLMRRIRF